MNGLESQIAESVNRQEEILFKLGSKRKRCNVSQIIVDALEGDVFKLADDLDDLPVCDGIIRKKNLHLKPIALRQIIRKQPGYQKTTVSCIIDELLDSTVLQPCGEENTYSVGKMSSGKKAPRTYSLSIPMLYATAKRISLDEWDQ